MSNKKQEEEFSVKLWQENFNKADLETKIKIFSELNHGDEFPLIMTQEFCQRNWSNLIRYISTPRNGRRIYNALYNEAHDISKIWGSVAALRTIEVWANEASSENYAEFIEACHVSLRDAWQVEIARQTLDKL
ncbi:hypothetical protein K9M09_00410 [Patescibacteria group bacterium]|nr:hypothetical protein [Patescibacteria group bacterium]